MFGMDAIVRIFSHFIFIYLVFWSLQSLRMDTIFKKGQQFEKQIKVFYLIVAIFIGYTVSNFFMEVMFLSRDLIQGVFSR
ncbi:MULTISPECIES: DUF1146 family protein [Vagococcus]|uniref:DUF1146 domain-containing protein n=1 Tax=Vagococcus fluvialis bH819 TaxID=1255619 RepID=A0A1X6WQ62_9ENTE|nr:MULTISPECIES: DUF1146 family protein [Vagococcus]SLM86407.1 hypothetical protein FM121_09970 [Vagococcus fluvialis bH819]HCM89062.1 DUF1146 domain-containing protein [Vagococcus sp.]